VLQLGYLWNIYLDQCVGNLFCFIVHILEQRESMGWITGVRLAAREETFLFVTVSR